MNPWPTARRIVALLATITATANLPAVGGEDQAPTPDATAGDSTAADITDGDSAAAEITAEQAKELILDFISAEEAKEKKAGQKTPFFVTASRPILEKREMVRDDQTGMLIWGPWQIDPGKRVVRLQTSAIGFGKLAWQLTAEIKRVDGKFRLADPKVIEIHGLGETKATPR